MRHIGNAGLLLFDFDLLIEFGRHALEVGDHHFDLRHLATFFVDLELLEPDQALATRLHDLHSLHIKSGTLLVRTRHCHDRFQHLIAVGNRGRLFPLLREESLHAGLMAIARSTFGSDPFR